MTVTRSSLAESLFVNVGLNKKEAREVVRIFFDEIHQILQSGQNVKLLGFGKFEVRHKNARPGRNPKTGEEAMVTARSVVVFRPGQKLKSLVRDYAYKAPQED